MPISINNNSINMNDFKGDIKRCPYCVPKRTGNKDIDDANLLAALSNTNACKWCMSHRFISICTNCNGTGKFSGSTIWDGGKHPHTSTCNPCCGQGMYPARKPADWVEPELTVADITNAKVVEPRPVGV